MIFIIGYYCLEKAQFSLNCICKVTVIKKVKIRYKSQITNKVNEGKLKSMTVNAGGK